MWRLFRRRHQRLGSLVRLSQGTRAELKQNPSRLEHELEQSTQWALRVAAKKLQEISHRLNEKET